MSLNTPVTRALDEQGISYRVHVHDKPLKSLYQAARERGLEPSQIVRSLLFRIEDGSFVMVLAPGPGKVAWPKLRHFLGVSRVTTARAEEVQEVTGYPLGAVSPFGISEPVRILADRRILEHETVSLGVGVRNAGLVLKREDLLRSLDPEMGDFLDQ
jgi:Cys-tRNA(Pro)/Cys-tRNA(Cys) deacylase